MAEAAQPSVAARLKGALDRFESGITAYDLFAAGVVAMGWGRLASTFEVGGEEMKLPLRMLLPVFMIPVGYNVGRRVDWRLVACCLSIIFVRWLFFNVWYFPPIGNVPINFLAGIIATRIVIEPLMEFALKGKAHFWLTNLALAAATPWLHGNVVEYGTLGTLMAMAGWLARNRGQLPKGFIDVRDYFILVLFFYLAINQSLYEFTPLSFACMAAGAAYVFRLCYNFRKLLLNSLHRKPQDMVAKAVHFMGRNSLEIYTLFVLVSYALFFHAITTQAQP